MILSALYCRQGVAGAEEALAGRAVDPDAGAKEGGGQASRQAEGGTGEGELDGRYCDVGRKRARKGASESER